MIAMAEEQLEWVFDSLIEFLRGPVWNIPILTFIEQKSVGFKGSRMPFGIALFEPGSVHDGEFKKIHEEYKNLKFWDISAPNCQTFRLLQVDFMLGSYMDDLKINPEQFEKACTVASKKALTQFHKGLFEQVWAADDFEIFQRMMTQKNLELQLQALEVLATKFGLSPDFMNPGPESRPTQEEEKIMKEVIRRSMEENQGQQPCLQAVADSEEEAMQVAFAEKMRLEAERSKERELMEQAMKLSVQETSIEQKTPPAPASTPTTDVSSIISCTIEQNPGYDARNKSAPPHSFSPEKNKNAAPVLTAFNSNVNTRPNINEGKKNPVTERPWSEGDQTVYTTVQIEASPLDLERRQNYLRQQRDRLLALKRQERAKHLNNIEEQTSDKRPKSARAARKMLTEEEPTVDPQTLAFRKSLASRLRSEVVDSSA